jgi:hypothetical protein
MSSARGIKKSAYNGSKPSVRKDSVREECRDLLELSFLGTATNTLLRVVVFCNNEISEAMKGYPVFDDSKHLE